MSARCRDTRPPSKFKIRLNSDKYKNMRTQIKRFHSKLDHPSGSSVWIFYLLEIKQLITREVSCWAISSTSLVGVLHSVKWFCISVLLVENPKFYTVGGFVGRFRLGIYRESSRNFLGLPTYGFAHAKFKKVDF